jgi:hypothetical protein
MNPEEIRAAITASPELLAMVGANAAETDVAALTAAFNQGRTRIVSHFASERGILDRYPGGPIEADALLTKLETFAVSAHPLASVVRRATKFLGTPEGIDLGSGGVQAMLAQLTPALLTTAERDGLRAMASVPVMLSPQELQAALFDDFGAPL